MVELAELGTSELLERSTVILHVGDFEPCVVPLNFDENDLIEDQVSNYSGTRVNWSLLSQIEVLGFLVVEVLVVAVTNPLLEVIDTCRTEGTRVFVFGEASDFPARIAHRLHYVIESIGIGVFGCVEQSNWLGDPFV